MQPALKPSVLFAIGLLLAGCATINFRPTHAGDPVPIIGGTVTSPGAPWFVADGPRQIREDFGRVTVLTTGSYESFEGILRRAWTVNVGPIGVDPNLSGNEAILVLSVFYFAKVYLSKSDAEWAREDLINLYGKKGMSVTDVKDISSEYKDRLGFWNGQMFALAYKAGGQGYRVIHAFIHMPGPKPVLHDFSYIRMEKPGAKDRFNDFIAMLQSFKAK